MNIKLTLGERLKDLRVERHLKLEALAEQTGLSKSASVSYTHLDVYKRQQRSKPMFLVRTSAHLSTYRWACFICGLRPLSFANVQLHISVSERYGGQAVQLSAAHH